MDLNQIFFQVKGFLIRQELVGHVSMYLDQSSKRIVIELAGQFPVKAECGYLTAAQMIMMGYDARNQRVWSMVI